MLGLPRAIFGRVVAQDLVADDAPGWDAVDGDAFFAHLARQTFGPGVHRRFGAERPIDAVWLRFSRDIDDAAPAVRHHLIDQKVGQLTMAGKVKRDRFLPDRFIRVQLERS